MTGAAGVEEAARELGYPDRPVCFKPVFSSGSRGFRVLDPSVDRTHQLLNERPGALAMRLEEAVELLPEDGLDLLVMEFLTEPERTVDGIADGSRIVLQATRTRESVRCGLGMYFVTLDAPELVEASERIVAEFGLEWFFSIQFMGEKVIEINPRISTMMIQEDFNLPWLAVKRALGEASDDELRALQSRVRPGPHGASFLRPGGIRPVMDWQIAGGDARGRVRRAGRGDRRACGARRRARGLDGGRAARRPLAGGPRVGRDSTASRRPSSSTSRAAR